jgi:NAD-dependent DNA ligase
MLAVVELKNGKEDDLDFVSPFPQEFLDCLPEHCSSCGYETEITETLTILRCSNPQCGEKSVQRLVTLMKDINVKNMGESKCRQFLERFETVNPYAIFMYEADVDGPLYNGCSQDFSNSIYEALNKSRKMLLWEFLKIGNLPGIRDSARKLLAKYDDLEEFYDDLEGGGISFVQDLLSIKGKDSDQSSSFDDEDDDNSVSVKAVSTYNTLLFFKQELLDAIGFIEIMTLDTGVINLCISTSVGKPYGSKKDFIAQMNTEFGTKVHLNFLESISKDCEFLIWSKQGSATSKVDKINKSNAKRIAEYNEKKEKSNIEQGISRYDGFLDASEDYSLDECLEFGLTPILTGTEFKEYLDRL